MNLFYNKKYEILSTHYNETFCLLKEDVKKRDRLFVYSAINIFMLLLYMTSPASIGSWLNKFLNAQAVGIENYNQSPSIMGSSFIGTTLCFLMLSLLHTYFQTVLHVERQYKYVYLLENQLSLLFKNKAFIREGEHYKANRNKFSVWTKFIFWTLYPGIIFFVSICWLIFVCKQNEIMDVYAVINIFIFISIIISIVLYLITLYKKKLIHYLGEMSLKYNI